MKKPADRPTNERREFLWQAATGMTAFAMANTAVYLVGSAFKELDGSLVAGAKCAATTGPATCPVGIPAGNFGDSLLFDSDTCYAAGGNTGIIADCDNPSGPWHIQAF